MRLHHAKRWALPAVALSAVMVGGWPSQAAGGAETQKPPVGLPPLSGEMARIPLGPLVGNPETKIGAEVANPVAGQPNAVQQGKQMFAEMNCAGCHGYDAKGGMGPDLTGTYWRYGGTPAAIFRSIYEGRPQGMPAWGREVPPEAIWLIVAYIQSLGGTFPANAYQPSLQGDRPGELVTPELALENTLAGLPQAGQNATGGSATNPPTTPPVRQSGQR